jgi:hypothetical protein
MRASLDQFGQLKPGSNRRCIGRTKIEKSALVFFSGQTGVRSCRITDVTNLGAGLSIHDLPALPTTFELSFDNFHSFRKCRLIWRHGDFVGVSFEN